MKKRMLIVIVSVLMLACTDEDRKGGLAGHDRMDHEMGENELHLSTQQIQLGNIAVDTLRDHVLGEEFLIAGVVGINQNNVSAIASPVMGRIDKLYFRNVGDVIAQGEPLYEIYSEDLNIAIKELLLADEKITKLKNDQVDMERILESARTKLRLYGLTADQIGEIERSGVVSNTVKVNSRSSGVIISVDVKPGNYVMEGTSVFHLADLSSFWVEGQVYSDYLNFVKNGMSAKVTFPGYPDEEYEGKISFVDPELKTSARINSIRIEIPNKGQKIRPGIQAYINVLTNQVNVLAAPTDAIIRDGNGATVWVKTGENMFKSKMINIGMEADGFTEIVSGLEKGDLIVVSGAYLLNSEFIFRNGANPMEGHDMSKM